MYFFACSATLVVFPVRNAAGRAHDFYDLVARTKKKRLHFRFKLFTRGRYVRYSQNDQSEMSETRLAIVLIRGPIQIYIRFLFLTVLCNMIYENRGLGCLYTTFRCFGTHIFNVFLTFASFYRFFSIRALRRYVTKKKKTTTERRLDFHTTNAQSHII